MNRLPIVCAIDATDAARLAARSAGWLAQKLGTSLELVYVFDEGEMPALSREGAGSDPVRRSQIYAMLEARHRIRAHAGLNEIAREMVGIPVSTLVCDGRPVPVLQELVAERNAAVLVCGTAGRRGLEHVMHGSVSGALAAAAPCPVMLVGSDAAVGETGPVIVGEDGSAHSRRAARHASALAERLGRELVRMHVGDGNPVDVIADAARAQRACVVVAGTRGRGPVRTELFGSVSTGLVRHAGRPVIVVPSSAGDPP